MNNFGKNTIMWMGVVEDRVDPLGAGRLRVRCFGWHTQDTGLLPTERLPWAITMGTINSSGSSGIGVSPTGVLEGSWVIGVFLDGEDAQFPLILGTVQGVPANFSNPNKGFNDPNGVVPLRTGEPDVNRLSRNNPEQEHPLVNFKKDLRDDLTNEPVITGKTEYPYNTVTESESGHIQEIDDTPGYERLLTTHRTGTMTEMQPDGSKVNRVIANNYSIVYGDDFVRIRGNTNVYVDGNTFLFTRGNLTTQVDGDMITSINGNYTLDVRQGITIKSGATSSFDSGGNLSLTTAADLEFDAFSKVKFTNVGDAATPTILEAPALIPAANVALQSPSDRPGYVSPGGGNDNTYAPQQDGGPYTGSGAGAAPLTITNTDLGALSERYESNGNPCAIGRDSTGGWSYGKYQIATKTGTFDNYMSYLKRDFPDIYSELAAGGGASGAKSKTSAFDAKWKALCSKAEFAKSQHDFIQASHYEPAARRISKVNGIDVNSRSKALQDVVWSCSVQHGPGGAAKIFERAFGTSGLDSQTATDEEIINAVYTEREKTNSEGNLSYFRSSKQNVQASVRNRFKSERATALKMLSDEGVASV
jgi:hypothetical protein